MFQDEVITPITTLYKKFLHTEKGIELLGKALEIKKTWRKMRIGKSCVVYTKNVRRDLLPSVVRDKTHLLTIHPIGLNNMCHYNAGLVSSASHRKIKSRVGYNITACPCGMIMSFELHSVNKLDDTLFDITRDFNDEKEKYFMELDTTMTADDYIEFFGAESFQINKGCRCPITWKNVGCPITEQMLAEKIEMAEHTFVF